MHNLTTPTDGGSSVGIGIYGGAYHLNINNNSLQNGVQYGFRIGNLSSVLPANTDINLQGNNITGFLVSGMHVYNAPISSSYATCNFWGSASGPTTALSPGGTGNIISGDVIAANFNPDS